MATFEGISFWYRWPLAHVVGAWKWLRPLPVRGFVTAVRCGALIVVATIVGNG